MDYTNICALPLPTVEPVVGPAKPVINFAGGHILGLNAMPYRLYERLLSEVSREEMQDLIDESDANALVIEREFNDSLRKTVEFYGERLAYNQRLSVLTRIADHALYESRNPDMAVKEAEFKQSTQLAAQTPARCKDCPHVCIDSEKIRDAATGDMMVRSVMTCARPIGQLCPDGIVKLEDGELLFARSVYGASSVSSYLRIINKGLPNEAGEVFMVRDNCPEGLEALHPFQLLGDNLLAPTIIEEADKKRPGSVNTPSADGYSMAHPTEELLGVFKKNGFMMNKPATMLSALSGLSEKVTLMHIGSGAVTIPLIGASELAPTVVRDIASSASCSPEEHKMMIQAMKIHLSLGDSTLSAIPQTDIDPAW